jgi:alkanesulfonate monooxygenase SsuD/methylene tetrahydromethanopterin reductase-like flavin-dependent oxidoreductase (luciferase family)
MAARLSTTNGEVMRRSSTSAPSVAVDTSMRAGERATLDVISAGRVNLGIGWPNALDAPVFRPGDIPGLEETLDVMIAYWAGRPIVFEGVEHRVEPTPAQRPQPPVHVAARSEASIAWIAERGYALLLSALQSPASVHRCLDLYAEHGGDRGNAPTERFFLVAESDAEAHKLARPIVTTLIERLKHGGIEAEPHQIVGESDLVVDRFLNEGVLVGGPDTVAHRVAELRDGYGVRRINLRPSFAGSCPADLQRTSIALFAREVVPRIDAKPANPNEEQSA